MKYTTFRWRAKISFSPKGRDCTTDMWDVVNYIISYATEKEKEVCDALKDIIRNIDQTSKKKLQGRIMQSWQYIFER